MTASAVLASHHSIPWIAVDRSVVTQPRFRPASVAWIVAASGAPHRLRRATAAWATIQSWAWMTSGCQSASSALPWPVNSHSISATWASRSRGSCVEGSIVARRTRTGPVEPHGTRAGAAEFGAWVMTTTS